MAKLEHSLQGAAIGRSGGRLMLRMAREAIAIWRMLGFSEASIRSALNAALEERQKKSKYVIRHEERILEIANALGRWSTDAAYCDKRGAPAKLKFAGPKPSFSALIESVCPGFNPSLARDMFLEGASIHIDDDGIISRTRDFLPVFGGTGAIYSNPVLVCLRSIMNVQSKIMRRDPAALPTGGLFATCGSLLPRSKWDHFHWQARKIASSVFLLGEWIDANRVPPHKLPQYSKADLVEPVVVLSIEFDGNAKS